MVRSARGLFRATGHKPKPVAVRDLGGEIVIASSLPRAQDDFNPTPPAPTRAFIAAELGRLRDFPLVWENAAGDGAMVREFEAMGFPVFASDLVDRGLPGVTVKSFYDFTRASAPSRCIVSNPPFCECNWRDGKGRWMYHALDDLDAEYMALLLPWPFPGAAGHAAFWNKHPPARVYLMRWKIDFTGQGAPPMLNGWFIWDRKWQGETVLRMLDQSDPRQGALL